jgi:single-stranded-DNA-specific exonuclease
MYHQGVQKKIVPRPIGKKKSHLKETDPILNRIFLAREITDDEQLERGLAKLPSPWLLSGMEQMVEHLIQAIEQQQKITVVADFDADGATSCVVAIKGLELLGASPVAYVVPNRFEYGYGLTPEIVELVKQQQPDIILTVDNGISSAEGVEVANDAGIKVLITDHHLPGNDLPKADSIVNPNLPGDKFPSGNIAGVGVMFYVLIALRSRLRENGWFEKQAIKEPNLAHLLDFVALGTVADGGALDQVNRIFVPQGLLRICSGQAHAGINALIEKANKNFASINSTDLGFALGPRLNAAGRMDDMSLGIQCLLTDDEVLAKEMAGQLDDLNKERKEVEAQMKTEAMSLLKEMKMLDDHHLPAGVCLFEKYWHQGVIGILASRLKDRLHRPVVAFASADNGEIKGSARSIPGVHIRDVLSEIAVEHPKMLSKFGGHAMAAGMSIQMHDYPVFALAFDKVVAKHLDNVDLEQKIYSDGKLTEKNITLEFADRLSQAGTWGQAFPEPVFDGVFDVIQCRVVGQQHLKFVLRFPKSELLIDAIAFFVEKPENWLGTRSILSVYKLDVNEFRGSKTVQLMLQYIEKRT